LETTEWLKLYEWICSELEIDPSEDLKAAALMSSMIEGRCLSRQDVARLLVRHGWAVVFGAGPSLERDFKEFLQVVESGKLCTVAADGACRVFLENGLIPDVVVTDLDGGDEALMQAAAEGSLLVVHAHGDNIHKIRQLIPSISSKLLGTTQTEPVGVLENFGGFTDGDRAVYMCEELGVKNIVVAGMDFEGAVGKHSKPYSMSEAELARKRKKLEIGKRLLTILAERTDSCLYDVSSNDSTIKGFVKTTWGSLMLQKTYLNR